MRSRCPTCGEELYCSDEPGPAQDAELTRHEQGDCCPDCDGTGVRRKGPELLECDHRAW